MNDAVMFRDALMSALSDAAQGFAVEVKFSQPGAGGADFDIDLVPSSERCAPAWITVSGTEIDLRLGQDSRLGFTVGRSMSWDEALQRVTAILEAVVRGELVEQVWWKGERVVAARGILGIGEEELRMSSNAPLGRFGTATTVDYEPYPQSS